MTILGSIESQARLVRRGIPAPDPERDLLHYLEGEFRAGLPMRVSCGRTSKTGRELSDREVSRLEVESALRYLSYRQRRVMELRYKDDLTVPDVARLLGISERTYARERIAAFRVLVELIYNEWDVRRTA